MNDAVMFWTAFGGVVVVAIFVVVTVIVTKWTIGLRHDHVANPTGATAAATPSSDGVKWSKVIFWSPVWIPAVLFSLGCSGCLVRNWVLPSMTDFGQRDEVSNERRGPTSQQGLNLRGQWEVWSPGWTETPGPSGYGIGFIYPPEYVRRTATTYSGIDSEAYLVSSQEFPTPPLLEDARDIADSKSDGDVRTSLYRLEPDAEGEVHTFTWNDAPTMSVMYLLTAEPERVQITYQQHGFKQWLMRLDGPGSASFQVPGSNWEYLWVVPLRSQEHLATFAGSSVTPEGISRAELETALSEEQVDALVAGSIPNIAYRGLYWTVDDGPASPLLHALTWQHSELSAGSEITLGINVASGDIPDKPAAVLVGIKE